MLYRSTTPSLRLQLVGPWAILFLSGAAGLGCQIAWTRMFTTGLGHEMPAVLAVVTAFFSGLAVGAWLLDRPISRSTRPGRWYSLLEGFIGVWAVVSALVIPRANELVLHWIGQDPSPFRHWLFTFVVPFAILLPATAAMGGTLPAMERWVAPLILDGRCVGMLYAANTFGAVAGALIGVVFLVPALGYANTIVFLGALSLFCGVAAFTIRLPAREIPPAGRSINADKSRQSALNRTLFFTGLLGIGYEVLGVRALSHILEGTVYTFAITLSVYLLGASAGGALYQWRLRHFGFEAGKNWLLFGLATACALGVVMLTQSEAIYGGLRARWGDRPMAVAIAEMTVAAGVFGMPTVFMGAVFTHLAQFSRRSDGGVGTAVALNTMGCALAPMIFGAGLLPVFGVKWSLLVIVAGYLLLLLPCLRFVVAGGLAPLGLILVLPSARPFVSPPPGTRFVSYREGVMDSVAVVEYPDRNRSLLVNARFTMGGTGSVIAERRHAHLPLLLHRNPQRALFLGLGTGITFAAAGAYPELEADGVELVPEVIDAMPSFEPFNALPDGGGRLKVHTADARRFVRGSDKPYDVIVADLFHPARDGAGALYTLEHFDAIRRRLAPGGLFCQWLPLHQLDESMLKVIVRTFLEVFPHTDAWLLRFNVDTPVIGLVGRLEPQTFSTNWLEMPVRDPGLREQLRSLNLAEEIQLLGCWLAGPDTLRNFAKDARVNTDDRPVVVFGAPKFYYRRDGSAYGRLLALLDLPVSDPRQLLATADDLGSDKFARQLERFIAARNVYLRGLVAEADGRMAEAINAYVESARASADFSTGYARCLTIATQQAGRDRPAARALLGRLVEAQPERPVAKELLERISGP